MDSSKHADRMIQCVNLKFGIRTEPCTKVTTHINIVRVLRHDQSPNLSTKLLRQSVESGNYVLVVNAAS